MTRAEEPGAVTLASKPELVRKVEVSPIPTPGNEEKGPCSLHHDIQEDFSLLLCVV